MLWGSSKTYQKDSPGNPLGDYMGVQSGFWGTVDAEDIFGGRRRDRWGIEEGLGGPPYLLFLCRFILWLGGRGGRDGS